MVSKIGQTALTGMSEAVRRLEVTSHNVANALTPGFKAGDLRSADVAGDPAGSGVRTLAITRDPSSGPLIMTGNNTDFAIVGSGYFAVQNQEGETFFTRNGSFRLNEERQLVNSQGYRLLNSQGNPIPELPQAQNWRIAENGEVLLQDYSGNWVPAGNEYRIGIASIPSEEGLVSAGGTLYRVGAESGAPQMGAPGENGRGTLVQGFIEGSNVAIEREMVNSLVAKQMYEANLKVAQTGNEMTQELIDRIV